MYVSPIVHSLFLPFPLHCFDSSSLLLRPKIPPPTVFVKPTNKTQNRHFLSLSKPTPDSSDFNLNSSLDDTTNNFDTEPSVSSTDLEIETASEDDVDIEIIKLGKNSRRIACGIAIDANLEAVWNILTDYERLADFIPGLAVCQLLEKTDNRVRLFQIGQQNLAFGLKFNAKGIVDCYEKDIERIPFGQRRDIDFKMIEGDFQVFEGKWSIEEKNNERQSYGSQEIINTSLGREFQTTLSYVVDVKPKLWLPVAVVEGRLSREMKLNLLCIREQAEKAVQGTLRTL